MRIFSRITTVLICVCALITVGCVQLIAPEEGPLPSRFQTEEQHVPVDDEMAFCWWALSTFFIYQERLPQDPFALFTSPGPLYASVNDRYTGYVSPYYAREFYTSLTTETGGVGLALDSVESGYVIVDVYKKSPGEKAGLMEGDTVVSIDGESVAGIDTSDIDHYLTGVIGDVKQIVLIRNGRQETVSVEVGVFYAPTVHTDSLDANTAVVRLSAFLGKTEVEGGSVVEFREALRKTAWAENLILDLRGNGGGLVSQCVGIASEFLPAATPIVNIRSRELNEQTYTGYTVDSTYYTIESERLGAGRSIAILVNHNTASASEMLISGLREQLSESVTIYGTRTFGKGSGWYYFETPETGVAIVTGMLVLPLKKQSYNEIGIEPDVVLDDSQDALEVAYARMDGALAKTRPARPSVSWVEGFGPKKWMPALIID